MNIEQWENEGGYIQLSHSYIDGMGFEETHEGSQSDCMTKQCRRERKYYRSISQADPWNDGPDPWMEGSLNARSA
ncbi:hypothetical protein SEA_SHAM_194 [Streptomyces phage Sham]|nr:hypothetical protein SEA_SHAM_194 [Streptomyces phage Sham]